MKGRPDFIPAEVFRRHLKASQLSKYVSIDGVQAASFVQRCATNNEPLRHVQIDHTKMYRLIDLVARARADNLAITPPVTDKLANSVSMLQEQIAELTRERDALTQEVGYVKHRLILDRVSRKMTQASLLREDQIVEHATNLPIGSGVYFLIQGSKIIYVGQSVRMNGRVSEHMQHRDFDKVAYLPCHPAQMDILESLYIHVLQPPQNGNTKGGQKNAPLSLEQIMQMATYGPPTRPSRLPA